MPSTTDVEAENAKLDANWEDLQVTHAADIVDRGVFYARSVTEAILAPQLVATVIERTKVQPAKGNYLFLPQAVENTDNTVMKVTPHNKDYFDRYYGKDRDDAQPYRIATPDLNKVKPSSAMYSTYARIHAPMSWPALLTTWTDGTSIFVRKTYTEETWMKFDPKFRSYIVKNAKLFGLSFS